MHAHVPWIKQGVDGSEGMAKWVTAQVGEYTEAVWVGVYMLICGVIYIKVRFSQLSDSHFPLFLLRSDKGDDSSLY